jgi:flavin-binding protein dodecin
VNPKSTKQEKLRQDCFWHIVMPQRSTIKRNGGRKSESTKEEAMSVARVTEIISSSKKSFEDAIVKGIDRAAKTLKNVEGAWVKEQKVIVKNGKISEYRVDLKVTFILID